MDKHTPHRRRAAPPPVPPEPPVPRKGHIAWPPKPSRRVHSLSDLINLGIDWLVFPFRWLSAPIVHGGLYLRSAWRYYREGRKLSRSPMWVQKVLHRAGTALLVILPVLGLLGGMLLSPVLFGLCLVPLCWLIWRLICRRWEQRQHQQLRQRGLHLQAPVCVLHPTGHFQHRVEGVVLEMHARHPLTGEPMQFFSEPVYVPFQKGDLVHVLVDPQNPHRYLVDAGTLLPRCRRRLK